MLLLLLRSAAVLLGCTAAATVGPHGTPLGKGCGGDPEVGPVADEPGRRPLLPPWPATYNMSLSTAIMPCNYSGMFDVAFSSRFGIADYDWSNEKLQWANQHPMDPEERLVKQATQSHALNPESKTFVYRNLVHADNWMTTVREKLDDPAYSGFFVPFKRGGSLPNGTWHVPACDTSYSPPKCSELFHDQVNTPQHNPHTKTPLVNGECAPDPCDCGKHPCGEYVYDYRNGSMLQDFIVNEVVGGKMGVGDPSGAIRGFYTDDSWSDVGCAPNMTTPVPTCGPTEMDPYAVIDMGLPPAEVTAITQGWQRMMLAAQQKMLAQRAYTWQLLNCPFAPNLTHTCQQAPETAPGRDRCNPATGTTTHGPIPVANCTTWMRRHCGPADDPVRSSFHRLALFFGFTRVGHHTELDKTGHFPALFQDVAQFLCVRGTPALPLVVVARIRIVSGLLAYCLFYNLAVALKLLRYCVSRRSPCLAWQRVDRLRRGWHVRTAGRARHRLRASSW